MVVGLVSGFVEPPIPRIRAGHGGHPCIKSGVYLLGLECPKARCKVRVLARLVKLSVGHVAQRGRFFGRALLRSEPGYGVRSSAVAK